MKEYFDSISIIEFFLNNPCLYSDKFWKIVRKSPYYESLISKLLSTEKKFVSLLEEASLKQIFVVVIKKTLHAISKIGKERK